MYGGTFRREDPPERHAQGGWDVPPAWQIDRAAGRSFCYNVFWTFGGGLPLRRWLFGAAFSLAMGLSQVAFAASLRPVSSIVDIDAILIGVITLAAFLWMYSFIA